MGWKQALLFLLLACLTWADQRFYRNSQAAFQSDVDLDLGAANIPKVYLNVLLSADPYAQSVNPLYATFVGTFSNSGPHSLGVLQGSGQFNQLTISLERDIGILQGLWLETKSVDNLLLTAITCRIRETVYELSVPEQWLERWDSALAAQDPHKDGFSPDAVVTRPSSSTLYAQVVQSYTAYSDTGIDYTP
jgi:hypothetical protein